MTFDFTLQGVIKKNNMSKLMAATVFHDALHMVAPRRAIANRVQIG